MAKSKNKAKDDGLAVVFSFRMSWAEKTALDKLARSEGRTPSNMIRKLIAEGAGRRQWAARRRST